MNYPSDYREKVDKRSPISNQHVESTRILVFLIVSAFLMMASFRGVKQNHESRSKATEHGPMLAVLPSQVSILPGETASMAVSIASGTDSLAAVSLDIPYDEHAIDHLNFVPSTAFPVLLSAPTTSNGRFRVTLGVLPAHPYSGTGIIGTLRFEGVSPSQTTLGFSDATEIASVGKSQNTLTKRTSARVIVKNEVGIHITSNPTISNMRISGTNSKTPTGISASAGDIARPDTIVDQNPIQPIDEAVTNVADYSPFASEGVQTNELESGFLSPILHFFRQVISFFDSLF